jgi:hypothetical protein
LPGENVNNFNLSLFEEFRKKSFNRINPPLFEKEEFLGLNS